MKYKPTQFTILISHRIMQRVCTDIPPEPIQSDLQRGRPSPRHLKYAGCNSEPDIGSYNLDAGHPLGHFAAFLSR